MRVTSLLLIVVSDREENYWTLSTLLFIRRLWLHPIQWDRENVGITYKLLGVWSISIHLTSTWTCPIYIPPPLYGRFCLVLISTKLGLTFDPVEMPINTWYDDSGASTTHTENTSPARHGEIVSYSHSISRSCLDAGNPMGQHSTLCAGLLKSSGVSYKDSHLLSVFVFNTSLHVTLDNFFIQNK